MYEILIGLGILSFSTFMILLFIDKELHFLSIIGINKTRYVDMSNKTVLIPTMMRKYGHISTFSLYALLTYYIINITSILLIITHFIVGNQSAYWIGIGLLFLNLLVLMSCILKVALNKEQQEIRHKSRKNRL